MNAKTKALWVFSIFLVISAFVFFPSVASLLMLLAAVASIPVPKMQTFFAQRGLKGPVKVVFIVVLFVASCFLAPTSRVPSSDAVLESPAVTASSTPEPTPTPTPTPTSTPTLTPTPAPTPTSTPTLTPTPDPDPSQPVQASRKIYITPTGKKYHYDPNCNGGTYIESTLDAALERGLTPCAKCAGG